jgi:FdhD protein
MKKIDVIRINQEQAEKIKDFVAPEIFLDVYLNNQRSFQISCSGLYVNELVTGYLCFHRYINSISNIRGFNYDLDDQSVFVDYENDLDEEIDLPKKKRLRISPEQVYFLLSEMQENCGNFWETGAFNSSALATTNHIVKTYSDISPENTLFMLIGYSLLQNISFSDKLLFLTGSVTASVAEIAGYINCPFIISKSAPTQQAIRICEEYEIGLAGFVRNQSMNIYSGKALFDF